MRHTRDHQIIEDQMAEIKYRHAMTAKGRGYQDGLARARRIVLDSRTPVEALNGIDQEIEKAEREQ